MIDFANVVMIGSEHSSLGTIAARPASRMGLEIVPDPQPEQLLFVRGDQYSFVKRGIPALWQFFGTKALDPSLDTKRILEGVGMRYHGTLVTSSAELLERTSSLIPGSNGNN